MFFLVAQRQGFRKGEREADRSNVKHLEDGDCSNTDAIKKGVFGKVVGGIGHTIDVGYGDVACVDLGSTWRVTKSLILSITSQEVRTRAEVSNSCRCKGLAEVNIGSSSIRRVVVEEEEEIEERFWHLKVNVWINDNIWPLL
ncbi:unnamed protein product [Camellia sinensis]